MRRIGGFTDPKLADQFNDYLQTQQIASKVDHDGESHDIWIRDEKDVDHARTALQEFTQSPNSAKFDVSAEAARLRKEQEAEKKRKLSMQRKSQQSLPGSSGSFGGRATMSGPIPVVIGMIVVCGLASYATSFGNPRPNRNLPDRLTLEAIESGDFLSFEQKLFSAFCFADPIQYQKTDDPWVSIKKGELWRFITPAFLHGSPMHLVFNMMALFTLGSVVERLHGSWFLALLLIVCQIVGTLVQVLLPDWLESPMAVGASGAVLGVFGYLWIRPKIQPTYPVGIPTFNVYLILGFVVACMTPWIDGIANGAHVGGLAMGVLFAVVLPKSFG